MSKITKSHSTLIESRSMDVILDFLERNKLVRSYTAGIIIPKRPPSKTEGPTKITMTRGHLKLDVNSKSVNQEIHIFGDNIQSIAEDLTARLLNEDLKIRFGKHEARRETKIR